MSNTDRIISITVICAIGVLILGLIIAEPVPVKPYGRCTWDKIEPRLLDSKYESYYFVRCTYTREFYK
jgi:hypothetical protein